MKKIFFLITITLLISSCEKDYWEDEYTVINNSSHDITIYGFNRHAYNRDSSGNMVCNKLDGFCEEIVLLSGLSHSVSRRKGDDHDDGTVLELGTVSIYIAFDNEKFISFACDDESDRYCTEGKYNLTSKSAYQRFITQEKTLLKRTEFEFVFEFTDEDYKNAKFIE